MGRQLANCPEVLMSFDYLLSKIQSAPLTSTPYPHIYIADFFSPEHLAAITGAPEIRLSGVTSDQQLFESLFANGYKIIDFPGCITDRDVYMKWHQDKQRGHQKNNSACEGFGVTVRLTEPKSDILNQLLAFMASDAFEDALASRFSIDQSNVRRDFGIQKYLDGYEISPHPDIRQKALTYMVNVNPSEASETADHHTHYLKFRPEYKYVQAYWEGNLDVNRCWVPWEWCESVKTQSANNSIVIFAPSDETMHGVKANYDHLVTQRTQLYGNLWYKELDVAPGPEWEDFTIFRTPATKPEKSLMKKLKAAVPPGIKDLIKGRATARPDDFVITNRLEQD
jgi:hypothetical protein